jgi:hypothetical protein
LAKLSETARLLAHRLPHGRAMPATPQRQRTPAFVAAKAVGSFVPRLTQKAFEKYGFSAATLLTDWATIVGQGLARDTLPERLKWPRHVETYGEVDESAAGRPGATLVLKVDPARALDIEYKRAQILDRINGYFGYRAVAEIRIVQAPLGAACPSPSPSLPLAARPAPVRPTPPDMSLIADDGLRAALTRLHAGVTARVGAG